MAHILGWERRAHIFGVDWPEWDGSDLQRATADFTLFWWVIVASPLVLGFLGLGWVALLIVAPAPRIPFKSEKQYITIQADGSRTKPAPLPCWYDDYEARRKLATKDGTSTADAHTAEPAELLLSVIVPAFNEEQRIQDMLSEAVDYLDKTYGSSSTKSNAGRDGLRGWEIIVVSDGSTDKTEDVVLDFAKSRQLSEDGGSNGAVKTRAGRSASKNGTLRVVTLKENRGKGGAVTHGMRHARGQYVIFADADGASRFSDVDGLMKGCDKVKDASGRAVAVGSRHHLVGSEAVVEVSHKNGSVPSPAYTITPAGPDNQQRSFLRNALMHSFHVLLWVMTPRATASIKDTQCGFKMFTRTSLPYIVPYMHVDGWIFDVEMLMLAEYAGIPMVEVSIGWKEVKGSKLNVIWDSLGMAWSLFVLRASWLCGVYTRDF